MCSMIDSGEKGCKLPEQILFNSLVLYLTLSMSFSYIGTGLPGLNQYLARINFLAQGHNAVTPVRLEPMAPWS